MPAAFAAAACLRRWPLVQSRQPQVDDRLVAISFGAGTASGVRGAGAGDGRSSFEKLVTPATVGFT